MKKQTFYFNSKDKLCIYKMSQQLGSFLSEYLFSDIVILCIGSDRSTGDSLGPLIGYKLQKSKRIAAHIYGTLSTPVHAVNLDSTVQLISKKHPNSLVIAIDAAVGTKEHIGFITLGTSPIKPGLGVHKDLPAVGDICITGIVNLQSVLDNVILQSTRLDTVMTLADNISESLIRTLCYSEILSTKY